VFRNRDAIGTVVRVLGISSRVTEALVARIISLDDRGFLNFLRLVAVRRA
jgi:hypothetical protein